MIQIEFEDDLNNDYKVIILSDTVQLVQEQTGCFKAWYRIQGTSYEIKSIKDFLTILDRDIYEKQKFKEVKTCYKKSPY